MKPIDGYFLIKSEDLHRRAQEWLADWDAHDLRTAELMKFDAQGKVRRVLAHHFGEA